VSLEALSRRFQKKVAGSRRDERPVILAAKLCAVHAGGEFGCNAGHLEREGKVKRTAASGVKEHLKPYANKVSEPRKG